MNLSDGSFPQRVRMRLTGQVHAASCRQELSHPTAYFVPGRRESCSQPVGNPAPDRLGILFPTGREQDSLPAHVRGRAVSCFGPTAFRLVFDLVDGSGTCFQSLLTTAADPAGSLFFPGSFLERRTGRMRERKAGGTVFAKK